MFFATGRVGRQMPSGSGFRPSLDISLSGPTLDSRFTFARAAGSATYFDVNGLIQTAGTNVPRFDYDPYNHALRGLYMEEARTNLALQSGDFTNAAWSKISCTLGAGVAGPNGSPTGSGLISNAGVIGYLVGATLFTPTPGTAYTASCFVRAGSLTTVLIIAPSTWWADAAFRTGTFNLAAGTVASVAGSGATGTIVPIGNGWYRISMTFTPDAAVLGGVQIARASANGDGTTIQHYAFGAQFEAGAFATSYIPTTTIAGARAIETCTMPVGSWFNQGGPGSLAIDWMFEGRSTGLFNAPAQFVGAVTGTDYIDAEEMSGTLVAPVVSGASEAAASVISTCNFTPSQAVVPFVPQRGASAWAIGAPLRAARAGVSAPVNSGNIAGLPTITSLSIAGPMHFQTMTSCWTKRVRYWPRALTDTELLVATAPDTAASLELDFLNNTLDSRITFTRAAGAATYFDATGVLQNAGTNVPRFDYDPLTHASRGLLVEEGRTNLVLRSDDFTNASWAKTACTLAVGILGPNGAVTGSGIIANNGQQGYLAPTNITPAAGTTITFSIYAKAGTGTNMLLLTSSSWWADATARFASFNLVTGTITSTTGGGATSTMTAVGNGWYRCTITATPDTAVAGQMQFARVGANGDGVSIQHYAFGAQYEVGAFASSFIPTAGVAVTRAADVATMPIGPWFNYATANTLAADYMIDQATNTSVNQRDVGGLSDAGTNNRMMLRGQTVGLATANLLGSVAGSTTISASLGNMVASIRNKVAGAWDGTNMVGSLNGAATVTTVKGVPSGITTLTIGNDFSGAGLYLNGCVGRVRYWPRALSNAELQTETT